MKKLELKPGDVVVIRVPPGQPQKLQEQMKSAGRAWLKSQGLDSCRLLIVADGLDIEAFPVEYMERCGWVRRKA